MAKRIAVPLLNGSVMGHGAGDWFRPLRRGAVATGWGITLEAHLTDLRAVLMHRGCLAFRLRASLLRRSFAI
ncbi:hypothetical protein LCGC14_0046760 [marine sediment metagenome]|jgi:hypothetical protein|uniref:Uncharacterized protein n=1 Tax=marine sediment metagenome TaxID=412755 RepID=A0A0F9VUD9_9ZZZZ|nr:MAG: hypothetical protein CBB97_06620 [Candidatus Endolissoclinum sp. TMED37]